MDSPHSDFSHFAYQRIKRLKELSISPSVGSVQLHADLQSLLSSGDTGFIPFIRERSSLGKLLRTESNESRERGKRRAGSVPRRGHMSAHPARLRKVTKCSTPGVGFYGVKYPWEHRPTYNPRKPHFPPTPPPLRSPPSAFPLTPTSLTPVFQHISVSPSRPKPASPDKFDVLKPEVMLKRIEKTNFQSVKLVDTPEELMASFQFKERRKLKDEKLFVVKRFMRRMLKGKFY